MSLQQGVSYDRNLFTVQPHGKEWVDMSEEHMSGK
jgi:hypothetical protein